ncbi:MAG: PKD domain-containing protein [Candidatus Eisenbacteria bacterium]|nr:PKD domain-containing protein [Candidatus Eisenbacteria bacterium]
MPSNAARRQFPGTLLLLTLAAWAPGLAAGSAAQGVPTFDPTRYRIHSVLGAGSCEGLRATETSISPRQIALGPEGELAMHSFDPTELVRVVARDGAIRSLAWHRNTYPDSASRFGYAAEVPRLPELISVGGIAVDGQGRVLVSDRYQGRIFWLRDGQALPLFGTGPPDANSGGDGGLARDATFGDPYELAVAGDGGLFVTDQRTDGKVVFRFINLGCAPRVFYPGTASEITVPPGGIATVAGGGNSTDDGIPALQADFLIPSQVTTDAQGNLFFGEWLPGWTTTRVRAINVGGAPRRLNGVDMAPGVVQTLAGASAGGLRQDGIPARLYELDCGFSTNVVVDGDGNFYVAEFRRHDILRVDVNGTIARYAGTGARAYTPPGGARLSTAVVGPRDLEIGPDGSLFYAASDEYAVRRIDLAGTVHQVAGNGYYRRCGDGGPAVAAHVLFEPQAHNDDASYASQAVADVAGNVYVADLGNNVIRRISADGTLSTVVGFAPPCAENPGSHGGCRGSFAGDGGPYADARLNFPQGLAVDQDGLYIADTFNQALRYANFSDHDVLALGTRVAPGSIETVAGRFGQLDDSTGAFCPEDPYLLTGPPPGTTVRARGACVRPDAIALLPNGDMAMADYLRRAVWRVSRTGELSLIAGRSAANGYGVVDDPTYSGCPGDGGVANQYPMCGPTSLATDELGNLYVGQQGTGNIGLPTDASNRVDYINLGASPVTVHGVTVPPGEIRRIVGVLGDGGSTCFTSTPDGIAGRDTRMCGLHGVAAVGGLLFYSDSWNARVRVVDGTGLVYTLAGAGTPLDPDPFPWAFAGAYAGDGGPAQASRLLLPGKLSIAPDGSLLISDDRNFRVRRIVDCAGAGATDPLCQGATSPPPPLLPPVDFSRSQLACGTPPVARLTATPRFGNAPLNVSFDGLGSSDGDPGDAVVAYAFDFGDGTPPETRASALTSHSYSGSGLYPARLTVTDSRGVPSAEPDTVLIAVDLPTSAAVSLAGVRAEPGRVRIEWWSNDADAFGWAAWKREPDRPWRAIAPPRRVSQHLLVMDDAAVAPGGRYAYRLAARNQDGAEVGLEEVWVDVPGGWRLALEGARPNPTSSPPVVSLTLADASPARLQLVDVAGRVVIAREVGALGPGHHLVTLGPQSLRSGIYFVRLTQGQSRLSSGPVVVIAE